MTYFNISTMTVAEFGIFAILAYAASFMAQLTLSESSRLWHLLIVLLSIIAVVCHGLQLHWLIDLPQGQNLSGVNLLSLLTWLAATIVLLSSIFLPVRSLNLLVFPFAILTIGLSEFYQHQFIIAIEQHPVALFHILLSTLIVALLVIAGIQALLVLIQQYCLNRKKLLSLLQLLPALQIMQRLLFLEIILCFLGLTLLLMSSLVFFETHSIENLWLKSLLTAILWGTFLFLVLGRTLFKWRSRTAAIWTTAGVGLSILIYLSSHVGLH